MRSVAGNNQNNGFINWEVLLLRLMEGFQCERNSTPTIRLSKPVLTREMERAALDALRNEPFVFGESVHKFEEEFAKYCGVDHAVSTNSGTEALHLALIALGVKGGQKVITTPATFIATSNAILHAGATPVFADIDPQTYNIDPEAIEKLVDKETRAIIPVHLYGYPADMDSINEVATKHGLHVIEDACQAHGALYKGRKAGSLGDVACFSFYPTKNMTVGGDGGMLVTNDEKVAAKVAKLRDCGRKSRYVHDVIGFTARMNSVNAAIGRVQLKHLDQWNEKRRRNANAYYSLLSDVDELILPPHGDSAIRSASYLYTLRAENRDGLQKWLELNGIQCGIHFPIPVHLQPVYQELFGYKAGAYPRSEELCRTCVSIPVHPALTRNEVIFISERIHEFFKKTRGG
jgi:perosamine synthetase